MGKGESHRGATFALSKAYSYVRCCHGDEQKCKVLGVYSHRRWAAGLQPELTGVGWVPIRGHPDHPNICGQPDGTNILGKNSKCLRECGNILKAAKS